MENNNGEAKFKGLNSDTNTKADKKRFIKKILASAIKMKEKLNDQLRALTHNEVFSDTFILNNLNFS